MTKKTKRKKVVFPKLTAKRIALAVVALLLIFTGVHYFRIWKDTKVYSHLDTQVQGYTKSITDKLGGKITSKQYCGYISAKFNEGGLWCSVDSTLEVSIQNQQALEGITKFADARQRSLNWEFAYGNTKSNQEYTSANEIKYLVYKYGGLYCGVDYSYKENNSHEKTYVNGLEVLIIQASCTGDALAEHYRVVTH